MKLNEISPKAGSTRTDWRRGRGPGSGNGKTAGRGHKGQKSRSGYGMRVGFEGGQMPLYRRLPKRGFTNIFRVEYVVVNVDRLEANFAAGARVTPEALRERGVVNGGSKLIKILGDGDLSKTFTVVAHKVSKAAEEKIKSKGGTVEILEA